MASGKGIGSGLKRNVGIVFALKLGEQKIRAGRIRVPPPPPPECRHPVVVVVEDSDFTKVQTSNFVGNYEINKRNIIDLVQVIKNLGG